MPFTDDFVSDQQIGQEFRADIDVFVCQHCFTAQTQHDVDVGYDYENYQYSVGGSAIATRFMRLLAENLRAAYRGDTADWKILEVGSGDGEQLAAFRDLGCRVLGYEPSSVLCETARRKGITTIHGLFTEASVFCLPTDFREVDVVLLSYTFDHLPAPRAFLSACRSIINKRRGLLVVEIHDLKKIIERQEYCLFEHEHSVYLTQKTAQQMCLSEGFEIIDFDLVCDGDRRANSLLFVATPKESDFAQRRVEAQTPDDYSRLEFYRQVERGVHGGICNVEAFVDRITSMGKRVAGYGAGGRGVMTLAAMRNAANVSYVVDKKPKGQGLVLPKTGIPLVALDALRRDPVDEVLVFSFGYLNEIHQELGELGYPSHCLHSLLDVLGGRF